jgi:hypothetical protein
VYSVNVVALQSTGQVCLGNSTVLGGQLPGPFFERVNDDRQLGVWDLGDGRRMYGADQATTQDRDSDCASHHVPPSALGDAS